MDHRGVAPETAPISRRAKARAKDSKEDVTTAAQKDIPQGDARNSKKEGSQKDKETITKGMVKDGVGEKAFGMSTGKTPKEIGSKSSWRRRSLLEASSRLERRG